MVLPGSVPLMCIKKGPVWFCCALATETPRAKSAVADWNFIVAAVVGRSGGGAGRSGQGGPAQQMQWDGARCLVREEKMSSAGCQRWRVAGGGSNSRTHAISECRLRPDQVGLARRALLAVPRHGTPTCRSPLPLASSASHRGSSGEAGRVSGRAIAGGCGLRGGSMGAWLDGGTLGESASSPSRGAVARADGTMV